MIATKDLYDRLTLFSLSLIIVGAIAGILTPVGMQWDFANFYDTGRRVAAGQIQDIYRPASWIDGEKPLGYLAFYGTPLSAFLYAPLSAFEPATALILFKVQNTLAWFASLILLFLHNRRFSANSIDGHHPYATLFAVACLLFQPFWSIYRIGGQTTPIVLLLFCFSLLSCIHSRNLLGPLFLLLACMIKPVFASVAALLIFVSGAKFARNLVVLCLLAAVVSVALLGWNVHREFLLMMRKGFQESYPWYYNSSVFVTLENLKVFGGPAYRSFLGPIESLLTAGIIVLFIWILKRSRSFPCPDAARKHFQILLAFSFSLMIARTVWEHYLSILFIPLAYILASTRYFSKESKFLTKTIFFMAIFQNVTWMDLLQGRLDWTGGPQLILVGILKSAPLLLFLWLLARHHHDFFESYKNPRWLKMESTRWV